LSESLRGFLRRIVTNAAFDQPVLVLVGEFVSIRRRHRMRRTVGIAVVTGAALSCASRLS
jgi:hypothetical protein